MDHPHNFGAQALPITNSVELDLKDLDLGKLQSLDETALGAILQELLPIYINITTQPDTDSRHASSSAFSSHTSHTSHSAFSAFSSFSSHSSWVT